ncbi:PREDICTED: ribosome biogenesis protein BRX1 homolog [Elephantulus edwardii]|uniref:ribosome biogenesis protein BRX1 homolog n=1 Tax=Elephantulus edwardii TaxID=28737 RepID=UPI0003F0F04A|nr:PREDICTED: ribosome biogenesis protein BRX1 homolog [Elephantulus edwardii]
MAATKRKCRGDLAIKTKRPKRDEEDVRPPAKLNDTAEEGKEEDRDRIPGPVCKGKWKNKERILIFSSRGINFRTRHLMQDLHRRIIRSITAAKYREKQQVKDVQKLRKKEPKTVLPHDPTADVFATPAEEKPVEIEWVKPEPKVDLKARKKRVYKRQRKMRQKLSAGNAK